ncbi:MAG: AbrB/MazE/SpoVT family DNA-binding domain-containing protein [Clostridia bacterium]|nr:AbrB/MazE/SpoVT family DNA-binding domain-containing protein [Clostridia bacterium]
MRAPKGKHVFGTVKVGEKGQIVIPKAARDVFDIKPGDQLLLLGDEKRGIAIIKGDAMQKFFDHMMPIVENNREDE